MHYTVQGLIEEREHSELRSSKIVITDDTIDYKVGLNDKHL